MTFLDSTPTPPRWFEFLLKPNKLLEHLETPNCDPSPTKLITFFIKNSPGFDSSSNATLNAAATAAITNGTSSPDSQPVLGAEKINDPTTDFTIPPDSYEAKYRAKKAFCLQTLALKVASFLHWDLDVICNELCLPVQWKLIQGLVVRCQPKECPPEVKKFAEVIHHQWFVRSATAFQISSLRIQPCGTTIIYLSQLQQQQQAADSSALSDVAELLASSSRLIKDCSADLRSYLWELTHNKGSTSNNPFKKAKLRRPQLEFFAFSEKLNDWGASKPVDAKGTLEGACYDLGRYFFFEESYSQAKEMFELIKNSGGKFPKLRDYIQSSSNMMTDELKAETKCEQNHLSAQRALTEQYIFECMTEFSKSKAEDVDLRLQQPSTTWASTAPLEMAKGDLFMSQGNFHQAMGCFVGSLMLMTDYFRTFSKDYTDEEPCISRMTQCSISLSCFTQAVVLCQMSKNLNYALAFKKLNERLCNDCREDMYECIWNVTLLEYIINLHSKWGEVEQRTKVIQSIGQLELNENNSEDVLKEAEHIRRGRFFRIMANKYL